MKFHFFNELPSFSRTLHYKHKFMTSLSFKNCFITKTFREIDEMRRDLNMEYVLPLSRRERRSYVDMTSIRLVKHEYKMIFEKCIFQLASTLQVCGIILADYSLFWLLAVVHFHGASIRSTESSSEVVSIDVQGSGLVAEMCKEIVNIFKPMLRYYDTDLKLCLPRPHHPNYQIYLKILGLAMLSWVLVIFEPFGFRIRQAIMSSIYPERSRERAFWLHRRILRKRRSFFKTLLNNQGNNKTLTCWRLFKSKISKCRILRKLFRLSLYSDCLLCGSPTAR